MTEPNYSQLYTYDELFNNAIAGGATVAQILAECAAMEDREERLENIALADLVIKGAQVFATLALAHSTRADAPARPKLRGL